MADLVAFSATDVDEKMSQGFTRTYNSRVFFGEGDRQFTNRNQLMWIIEHDRIQVHDIFFPSCNQRYYREVEGIEGVKTGYRNHLLAAFEPLGFGLGQITDTFNIFGNTGIDSEGRPMIALPNSRAGDYTDRRDKDDCFRLLRRR